MKRTLSLLCFGLLIMSCSSTKPSSYPEDELLLTRKFAGNFIGYNYTKPVRFGDQHIIFIKTSLDSIFGSISAYSKTCKFQPGERLYIHRVYLNRGGVWGDWSYQIESDIENISYKLNQLQFGNKILVQTWY